MYPFHEQALFSYIHYHMFTLSRATYASMCRSAVIVRIQSQHGEKSATGRIYKDLGEKKSSI